MSQLIRRSGVLLYWNLKMMLLEKICARSWACCSLLVLSRKEEATEDFLSVSDSFSSSSLHNLTRQMRRLSGTWPRAYLYSAVYVLKYNAIISTNAPTTREWIHTTHAVHFAVWHAIPSDTWNEWHDHIRGANAKMCPSQGSVTHQWPRRMKVSLPTTSDLCQLKQHRGLD
jgi:hypothetical protein